MGTAGQKKPEVAEPIIRVGIIREQEMIGLPPSAHRLEGAISAGNCRLS